MSGASLPNARTRVGHQPWESYGPSHVDGKLMLKDRHFDSRNFSKHIWSAIRVEAPLEPGFAQQLLPKRAGKPTNNASGSECDLIYFVARYYWTANISRSSSH